MHLRQLYNVAGAVTFSRLLIAAAMPFVVPTPWGLWVYLFALLTDVVDGAIARRTGTASSAGAAFDGWVDKTLHVNLAWSLAVADRIPDWWMLAWFSRELIQVAMHPVLMHGFRTGQGPAPRTSVLGRLTAVLLALCVVLSFVGLDAWLPTVLTGVIGAATGLDYARVHLLAYLRRDSAR
ncbi:MAG: CDP-alcohol phosphatidyltransferase family protein [Pseudomonadota bacterium]|nr:CDP-alcohol phosphatidyltransferase family protein [Pseudomonadota bacterium]